MPTNLKQSILLIRADKKIIFISCLEKGENQKWTNVVFQQEPDVKYYFQDESHCILRNTVYIVLPSFDSP